MDDRMAGTYTSESIGGQTGIMGIREDISRHLGSTGTRGILQMGKEIFENSLDESNEITNVIWKDNDRELNMYIKINADGSVFTKDQGRGIPVGLKDLQGKLDVKEYTYENGKVYKDGKEQPELEGRIAPTLIHALENDTIGGKNRKGGESGYQGRTGGVHGAGMCVTLAGCEYFDVVNTLRETNETWVISYKKGVRTRELTKVPTALLPDGTPDYGFSVHMKYDPEIFNLYDDRGEEQTFPYDVEVLKRTLANYVIDSNRVNIHLEANVPGKEPEKTSYTSGEYTPENLLKVGSTTGVVHFVELEGEDLKDKMNPIDYDLKVYTTVANRSHVMSMVNRLLTDKSSVTDSFYQSLEEVLLEKFRRSGNVNRNVPLVFNLRNQHIQAILLLGINNPEFSGQIKSEFHSPRLMGLLNVAFEDYFRGDAGDKLVDQLYSKILPSYMHQVEEYLKKENNRSKEQIMQIKTKAERSTTVKKRLIPSANTNYSECFLLIVEGDSGKTRVIDFLRKATGLPEVFAVFHTKGKLLNILTNKITSSNDQELFDELFYALNAKRFPWKRIVSFTDGDADGLHIRDLTTILMMEYYEPLIRQNRYSILQSPRSKLTIKDGDKEREVLIFSDTGLAQAQAKYGDNILYQQAYKGLAELSDTDLRNLLTVGNDGNLMYEYVVTPSTPSMESDKELYTKFYGKDTLYRKDFIVENFATPRLDNYLNTRADRMKDITFKVDMSVKGHDYSKGDVVLTTGNIMDTNKLTGDVDITKLSDSKYMTPVEFLLKMGDKYTEEVASFEKR